MRVKPVNNLSKLKRSTSGAGSQEPSVVFQQEYQSMSSQSKLGVIACPAGTARRATGKKG